MVLSVAAWTWGIATPASADAAANWLVVLMNSRREGSRSWLLFICAMLVGTATPCQAAIGVRTEWGSDLIIPLGASPSPRQQGEGWGEGHKYDGTRMRERLLGVAASSPRPVPPKEERVIESSAGGGLKMYPGNPACRRIYVNSGGSCRNLWADESSGP